MSQEVDSASTIVPSPAMRRRRRLWWAGVGIIVIMALVLAFLNRPKSTGAGAQGGPSKGGGGVPALTATARQGDIDVYLEALGIVTPVYNVKLTSRVQGEIIKIPFQEGQMVHKGDPLVEVDPRPYVAAQSQAEGHLAHDQAVLRQAQIDLTRYKSALDQKVIPQQQYDDQVQIVKQDEGTVKEDQGAADAARLNVEYCHITSPIDGRVGLRQIDVGNMVDATGTKILAVITQLRPIDVVFSIAEDALSEVQTQVASGAKLQTDVYDRNQSKKLAQGVLLTIDNVVDTTTGTVKLKAEFGNDQSELFPNQFVNVRLRVKTEKAQILVPTLAVQHNAQGAFVYLVKADQTVEARPIKVGAADNQDTAVTGIKRDDTVVTSGFDKIQDGVKIVVQDHPAPATPESTP